MVAGTNSLRVRLLNHALRKLSSPVEEGGEAITGADTRQQKQQGHEPRIEDIHQHILILGAVAKASNPAKHTFIIKKVDYVIRQH